MTDQPDELVIVLKKPIANKGGDSITQITLREPTGAEWKTWDKMSGVEADMAAIAKVSGQPAYVVEQMAASQIVEGSRYLAGFIQSAPLTGELE